MQPNPERLTFREKFAYGLGDTASNFFFQTFNIFLLYYYTDIFGLECRGGGHHVPVHAHLRCGDRSLDGYRG